MLIQLNNVKKGFKNGRKFENILEDIQFEIYEGESVAIKGRSGCGKSTLLNIIAGIVPFDSGQFVFNGKDISKLRESERAEYRKSNISLITQRFHLLNDRNVLENIALPLEYFKMPKKKIIDEVERVAHDLKIEHLLQRKTTNLSGGESQRVAIARAIIKQPSVLLADEPTGSLDEETEHSILATLDSLQAQGMTMIIVTHDDSVAQHCQHLYEIQHKRLFYVR